MKSKIFLFFFFWLQLQAQEKHTTSEFNFPSGVKEVIVKEFEVNRVTGDKILFKTTNAVFSNDLIQSRTIAIDNAPLKKEQYYYEANKLSKYESMDQNYTYYETYHYNEAKQLTLIKTFDSGVQSAAMIFKYNQKGQLSKKIIQEMDGFVSSEEIFTYKTPLDYTRKVSFKYATQEGVVDEYYYENGLEVKSKMDVNGAAPLLTVKSYDEHKNLSEIKDPITAFVNKYNENGHLMQTNINTDDNLMYTIVEYQYQF